MEPSGHPQLQLPTFLLINKQETEGSNNCVGEYKNVCEIEKKMFVVVLIATS